MTAQPSYSTECECEHWFFSNQQRLLTSHHKNEDLLRQTEVSIAQGYATTDRSNSNKMATTHKRGILIDNEKAKQLPRVTCRS